MDALRVGRAVLNRRDPLFAVDPRIGRSPLIGRDHFNTPNRFRILLHRLHLSLIHILNTPQALPGIIEYLLGQGYEIVPISQILLDGDYTIDHEGRQWPAQKEEANTPAAGA